MDKVRWETLVLAAAILLGALLISMAMRANRYYLSKDPTRLFDTQTATLYERVTIDGVTRWQEQVAGEDLIIRKH
jgi:hypothetical protein